MHDEIDIDCVAPEKQTFRDIQHAPFDSCDEKIYLDFNFHDNPQVEALAVKSFGVELTNHVTQERNVKASSNDNVLPHRLQTAYISEIKAKNLWSHDVQEKDYIQCVQGGRDLQNIWNNEVHKACQSIQDFVPTRVMQVAKMELDDVDYRPMLRSKCGLNILIDSRGGTSWRHRRWPRPSSPASRARRRSCELHTGKIPLNTKFLDTPPPSP